MANESTRASGRGFAFGASLHLSTGRLNYLIFYGQLEMGAGFDLMLQKYEGITCANNDNKPLGINGWYASGQLWSYIDAEIGIKYKNKEFNILKIGVASALQVKFPNPFWLRGVIRGKYRILNGLVKGTAPFKIRLGKNCDFSTEDDASSVSLIDDLSPADRNQNVPVNSKPIAYFSVPVNDQFTLVNDAGDPAVYNTELTAISLKKVGGNLVNGVSYFATGNREVTLDARKFLDGNTEYEFTATVKCTKGGALIKEETKTVLFTTDVQPDVIPAANVTGAYPANGMYNLYKDEIDKGFIALRDGMPYLLQDQILEARYSTKTGGIEHTVPVIIDLEARNLAFAIPANLQNNKFYRLDIVIPPVVSSTNNGNSGAARPGGSSGPAQVNTGHILHTLYFRTSVHNKFMDKVAQFIAQSSATGTAADHRMVRTAPSFEPFDELEINGNVTMAPLVQFTKGSGGYIDSLDRWYTNMRDLDFEPAERIIDPLAPSLAPEEFVRSLINGAPMMLRADVTAYNENAVGITNANYTLENKMFSILKKDVFDFSKRMKVVVQNECSDCQANYQNENYGGPGSNNCNVTYWACCCSDTYDQLRSSPLGPRVVQNNLPAPTLNADYPFFVSYSRQLGGVSNGGKTRGGAAVTTPGLLINFKYTGN
jgi:hypothetical protein